MNFVGYNSKSGYYFIRGFKKVKAILNITSMSAVEFDLRDIDKIQAFCMGAVCGYMVNRQKQRRWALERKKARSSHGDLPTHFDLANILLVRKLGLALNTVYLLKQKAHEFGFINISKEFLRILIDSQEIELYKRSHPEVAHKTRIIEGILYVQAPDKVQSTLRFKRNRKKFETIKKRN